MNKGFMIFSIVTGVIGTVCSVATAVDQIKNGDRRAMLTGQAAGETIVDECQRRKIGLFGVEVDENGKIK